MAYIKKKNKNNNKTKLISFRVSEKVRNNLEIRANNNNQTISQYMSELVNSITTGKKNNSRILIYDAVLIQDVSTYLTEKYSGDKYIEEVAEELWKNLL